MFLHNFGYILDIFWIYFGYIYLLLDIRCIIIYVFWIYFGYLDDIYIDPKKTDMSL